MTYPAWLTTFAPIRQLATVETISSASMTIIVDDDEPGSGWQSETQTQSETTTPKIREKEITAHLLTAEPRATQTVLDDARIDVESWLGEKIVSKFARDEATAFVNGTGVGQPRGITTYPAGTAYEQIEQVNSGTADKVTADGLFDIVGALKEPYEVNATWLMRRTTFRDIRKLKDCNGQYLLEPNLQVGAPPTLLGFPVRIAADMPAIGADALAIAFGDFRTAYTVVERFGVRVLRDPFTAKPFVKFYTTSRVGGDVVNFEAIKLQKIAA